MFSNFFTNVITVMNPMKQRYDFHSDADRPDHEYDYQAKLMKWHGDRAPLYSEGLDISRLPYQAGFMTDARWDPVMILRRSEKKHSFVCDMT